MALERPAIIDCILVIQILSYFTILCQGPKILNSLPVSITCLSSVPSFKKKMSECLLKQPWIGLATHVQHQFVNIVTFEVASPVSLVVSWGILAKKQSCKFLVYIMIRQINDDDEIILKSLLVVKYT